MPSVRWHLMACCGRKVVILWLLSEIKPVEEICLSLFPCSLISWQILSFSFGPSVADISCAQTPYRPTGEGGAVSLIAYS